MARPSADVPDPRSIITPDAFSVDPELLGLPLASPRRRLAAMLVDLVVVWLITLLLGGLGIALGLAAAAFFVWMATRKEGADRVFTWVFRVAVGCLGLFILLVTAGVFWVVGSGILSGPAVDTSGAPSVGELIREGIMTEGREQMRAGMTERGFSEIESAAEARDALREVARVSEKVGFSRQETRELLEDAIPEDAAWAEEADEMVDEAMTVAYGEAEPPEPPGGAGADTGAAVEGPAASPGAPDTTGPGGERQGSVDLARPGPTDTTALAAVLTPEATDSIATLLERLEELEAEREALEIQVDARDETIDELRDELEEAEEEAGTDLWASLQGLAETAGIDFGFFGWFALYFAFVMPRLNGRTVGKRMFGIRVLQLDGSPMNWFEAFERAGGYAAGVATGLLGFAQVYWDPNRQAIHDKIAGTVVVDERKPRVPGAWEKAMAPPGRVDRGPERRGDTT